MLRLILEALSRLYGAVSYIRNAAFDAGLLTINSTQLPVLSVGNLTAGGNGKTPISLLLNDVMAETGHKPVLLFRGYGGQALGPMLVSKSMDWRIVGDEPLMAARRGATVVISSSRFQGAQFIEKNGLGDLIILDDGFQHRRLERNCDIIVIDCSSQGAVDSFMKGELLPKGRFRESRNRGLTRADVVILCSRKTSRIDAEDIAKVKSIVPERLPVFEAYLKSKGAIALSTGEILEPCEVVSICAIANPRGFDESLRSLGFKDMRAVRLNDHAEISEEEISALRRSFPGLPIVCTEKDAVKIAPDSAGIYFLKVDAAIDGIDRLSALISGKVDGQGLS